MGLRALQEELKEDDKFQRYKAIRETAASRLPYDKLVSELDKIMSARQVRAYAKAPNPRQLLDVSLDEISHRARVTEIMKFAQSTRFDLSSVIDAVWEHAYTTYADALNDIKTKGDRERMVSTCFGKGNELLSQLDSLIGQCEMIVKDIDQASFHLNRVAAMFELLIRNDKLVNIDA